MNQRESAEGDVIADLNVSCQAGTIGHHIVVTEMTVVCDVHISHDPVATAESGDTAAISSTAIDGAIFTNDVAVTNLKGCALALELLVLCITTNGIERINVIVAANGCRTVDNHMRLDHRAGTDRDLCANARPWTDGNVIGNLGAGVDYCCLMNHDSMSRSAPMIVASATTSSPTLATAATRQMLRAVFSWMTSTISWSPGPTGFRNRALSIPTK